MPAIKRFEKIRFDYPFDTGFDIDGDYEKDPLCGWIEIRYVNEGERQKILQKAYPVKVLFSGKDVKQEGSLDRVSDREETAVAYIADWGNFYDGNATEKNPNGKPLKCTEQNKREFSREDGFMAVLNKMIAKATEIFNRRREEAEKN